MSKGDTLEEEYGSEMPKGEKTETEDGTKAKK